MNRIWKIVNTHFFPHSIMENSASTAKATSLILVLLMVGMTTSLGMTQDLGNNELSDTKESYSPPASSFPGSDSGSIYSRSTMALIGQTTCAVADDNTLRCWGDNGDQNDGVGGFTASYPWTTYPLYTKSPFWPAQASIDHNENATWVSVEGSLVHMCGITSTPVTTPIDSNPSNILCWGQGDNYRLDCYGMCHIPKNPGFPSNTNTVEVATGADHACSISPQAGQDIDDSSIFCWGRNYHGQLGTGDYLDRAGAERLAIPQGSQPVSIVAGHQYSCTLLSDGEALCWGDNSAGQLGTVSLVNETSPTPVQILPDESSIAQIVTGSNTTCALLSDGSVSCWGSNWQGLLGDGTTTSSWSTASNVILPTGRTAISIDMHYQNACAILDDNSLVCWGDNKMGQIANGGGNAYDSAGNRIWTVPVTIDLGQGVASVTVGLNHTCAITVGEDLFCWGSNNKGQVGIGNYSFSEAPSLVDLGPTDRECIGNCLPSFIPNSSLPSQAPGLSDRDPDDDGILSLFDDNPLVATCQSGYYTINGTGCYAADPGHFVPSSGLDYQTPCPMGTYQPNSGQSGCLDASPGHYTNVSSTATEQFPCHAGTYLPTSGQYAENDSAIRSIDGEATLVADVCISNSPGHYSDSGSPNEVPCPPGTYQPNSAYTSCIQTTPGYYTGGGGNTAQFPCEGGTYQPSPGQSSCFAASPGHQASPNSIQQEQCPPGTYSDVFGLEHCKTADPGYYSSDFGSQTQAPCLPGQYQPTPGQTSCETTDPGFYTSESGTAYQIGCDPGTFEPESGATSCSGIAQPGHYSQPGYASQNECEPGTYTPTSGMGGCLPADPGNHVPLNASTQQVPCPSGQFQPDHGTDSCLMTEPGHFSEEGASDQSACQPGSYQSQSEATSCDLPQPGNFVSQPAATEQTPCGPGEYQDEPGAITCIPAGPGTYSDSSGLAEPTPCPPGTYQPLTGQTECTLADRGQHVPERGAISQTPCERGTYQPESGMSECLDASPGHFVSKSGQTSQEPCLPGNFQPIPGAVGCIAAEPGHFVADAASSAQTACPSGEKQAQYGQTSCEEGSQLVMIAGGVAAIAILLMAMFMQSQKKPKRGGSKTGKRRKAVRRPRQVHDDSEE